MNTIWRGWRPTTKKYDPNDPHFNPMHPPKDTPIEVLEAFWGVELTEEERAEWREQQRRYKEAQIRLGLEEADDKK